MRMSKISWIVPTLLAMPLHAQGGWRDLEGEVAPEVTAGSWLNTGGEQPTLESLRGKVWLLEFFATW